MKSRHKNIIAGLLLLLGMGSLPVASALENHAPPGLAPSRTAQSAPWPESRLQFDQLARICVPPRRTYG